MRVDVHPTPSISTKWLKSLALLPLRCKGSDGASSCGRQGRTLGHIDFLLSIESTFGHATAPSSHGRLFLPCRKKPGWLLMGPKRACFNNETAYAISRDDVFYAEGYAIEPGLPIPVQHAWLVDASGEVLDPTWDDTRDHVYFGIAFKRSFVAETLARNKILWEVDSGLHPGRVGSLKISLEADHAYDSR